MSTPHVHAEVIKAWADGAQIQHQAPGYSFWTDLSPCTSGSTPGWFTDYKYRIKPETLKYRVGLFKEDDRTWVQAYSREDTAVMTERASPCFVRWLTDWIEVEI